MRIKGRWAAADRSRIPCIPALRAVKNGDNDQLILRMVDLIHEYIRQSRNHPLERARRKASTSNAGKRLQQFGAAEEPVYHRTRGGGTILRDPVENTFDVRQRAIVKDKLHDADLEPSREMRARASS